MSENTDSRRLLLIAPGEGASKRAPLGERQHIEGLLKELLPRLAFDADGTGTFTRNGKQLRLQIAGDPVFAIEMELPADSAQLMPPLERLVAKTGWSLIDPDHPETVVASPASPRHASRGVGQRVAVFAAIVPVVGGCLWWALVGSREHLITGDREAGLKMVATIEALKNPATGAASPGTTPPGATPVSIEQIMEKARTASTIMARERTLAPEFKGMRIVHELMTISSAEVRFSASVGNGNYVDPAMLVRDPSQSGFEGIRDLPPEFVATTRHGYRLEFIGSGKTKTFFEEFDPGYSSYVLIASPESAAVGPYTFALISETGRVHYRTDGNPPSGIDPSVTDRVSADAAPSIKPIPAEPNETRQESWLRRLINRFIGSPVVREAELTYHEDRAISDLRVFATAQEAFIATVNLPGYSPPEVLTNPSLLGSHFRGLPPFIDLYFAQEVREGYRFSFDGRSPIQQDSITVYPDYRYIAIPVGDGPSGRRSFSLAADGVIRFRKDGQAPDKGDTILGSEK